MAKDASLILNVPYTVTFNNADLGFTTEDGVEITLERNDVQVKGDQYGASLLKLLSGGENIIVTVSLQQWHVDNFKVGLPWGVVLEDGSDNRLLVGRIPGRESTNYVFELLLHRFADAASDTSKDIKLYKAICTEIGAFTSNAAGQTVLPLTFMATIDTSKSDGGLLGEIGTTNASTSVSS